VVQVPLVRLQAHPRNVRTSLGDRALRDAVAELLGDWRPPGGDRR